MISMRKLKVLLRVAILFFCAAAVSGCGVLFTTYAQFVKQPAPGRDFSPLKDDEYSHRLAEDFGAMALFAFAVYRHDLKKQDQLDTACAFADGETLSGGGYGLPRDGLAGWRRLKKSDVQGVKTCVSGSGLYFETYVHENENRKPDMYVVAFRGTENHRGQFWKDWSTNLSAIFGIQPKQYAMAKEHLKDLLQILPEDVPVYAVGHSLGGGLAQQSGYRFRRIKKVYAFNSSPVTNWTWLRLKGEVEQDYPLIYRFTHGGEILEPLRFVTTNAGGTRYRRYDVGVQYQKRSPFSGHSMEILACTLGALIADRTEQDPEPAYHFYRSYARETLFGPTGACDPRYKESIIADNIDIIENLFK